MLLYIFVYYLLYFNALFFLIYQTDIVPLFFRAGLRLANLLVPLLRRFRQEWRTLSFTRNAARHSRKMYLSYHRYFLTIDPLSHSYCHSLSFTSTLTDYSFYLKIIFIFNLACNELGRYFIEKTRRENIKKVNIARGLWTTWGLDGLFVTFWILFFA